MTRPFMVLEMLIDRGYQGNLRCGVCSLVRILLKVEKLEKMMNSFGRKKSLEPALVSHRCCNLKEVCNVQRQNVGKKNIQEITLD